MTLREVRKVLNVAVEDEVEIGGTMWWRLDKGEFKVSPDPENPDKDCQWVCRSDLLSDQRELEAC